MNSDVPHGNILATNPPSGTSLGFELLGNMNLPVDCLHSARRQGLYGRAQVTFQGPRVANARVELWQQARGKIVAAAHGHFLLSSLVGS